MRTGGREHAGAVRRLAALLAVLSLLLAACGDEESDNGGGETTGAGADTAEKGDCVAAWNDKAGPSLKSLAGLSHDPEADVLVGAYGGEQFTSEIFDTATTGTGASVTVAPGDCVVTQASDIGVLFVFVDSKDDKGAQAWHRISESGMHPLAKPSGGDLLEDPVRAGFGGESSEGVLQPK